MSVAVGGPVRSSSVGAAFRSPMMMVGAREGESAVRQAQGVQEVLGLLPEWDVRE